ncbi:hypothetical protein D9M71_648800 [compost metagenome]
MNRQPNMLRALSNSGLTAALLKISAAARAISTSEAPLVPRAVSSACLRPARAVVLTTSATTGPGLAIKSKTVRA